MNRDKSTARTKSRTLDNDVDSVPYVSAAPSRAPPPLQPGDEGRKGKGGKSISYKFYHTNHECATVQVLNEGTSAKHDLFKIASRDCRAAYDSEAVDSSSSSSSSREGENRRGRTRERKTCSQ